MNDFTQNFFDPVTSAESRLTATEIVASFEESHSLKIPPEYKNFLTDLEAYIHAKRTDPDLQELSALDEHIDDLFCNYYFTLAGSEIHYEITGLANISLGYALLGEMQEINSIPGFLLIGDIYCTEGYFFLALDAGKGFSPCKRGVKQGTVSETGQYANKNCR